MTATPEWKAINPKARIPALLGIAGLIGSAENLLTEVHAILIYLARTNPSARLLPEDPAAEARCIELMNWLSGDVHMMAYAQIRRPQRFTIAEDGLAAIRAQGRENVCDCYDYIDRLFADGRQWAIPEAYSIVEPLIRRALCLDCHRSPLGKGAAVILRRVSSCA
jgi:glutathione S-transferase